MSITPSAEEQMTFKQWLAVFGAILGAFMAVLDIQITNASIQAVTGGLGSTITVRPGLAVAPTSAITLTGVEALIAACARDHKQIIRSLVATEPQLKSEMIEEGGTLLAEFSGVGNVAGVRNLLDVGVSVAALYREGDGYFGIAKDSTALHVAAWRACPEVVRELIARGAPVNSTDAEGRTALQLAAKACVDSYWTERRSPDSIHALLEAGASAAAIKLPTGYEEADKLLRQHLA